MNYRQKIAELEAIEPGLYQDFKARQVVYDAALKKWSDCYHEIENLKKRKEIYEEFVKEQNSQPVASTPDAYNARPDPNSKGSPEDVTP